VWGGVAALGSPITYRQLIRGLEGCGLYVTQWGSTDIYNVNRVTMCGSPMQSFINRGDHVIVKAAEVEKILEVMGVSPQQFYAECG
jgi:hypothetical protein